MKRKYIFALFVVLIIFVSAGCNTTPEENNTPTTKPESNYYIFGKLYREMLSNKENDKDNIPVVAKYDGQEIFANVVEYQRKLNEFSDEETAQKYDTDIKIVNAIIEQMMLVEEAKRLGYTVTQEDIEAMVDSAKRAYSFPDGKEKVDEYCAGAGITLDEYYDLLRKDYPDTIMKNRLLNSVMKEYCEKNGIEYTQFNLPEEVLAAKQEFIDDLFQRNQHKIEYFIDTDSGT